MLFSQLFLLSAHPRVLHVVKLNYWTLGMYYILSSNPTFEADKLSNFNVNEYISPNSDS